MDWMLTQLSPYSPATELTQIHSHLHLHSLQALAPAQELLDSHFYTSPILDPTQIYTQLHLHSLLALVHELLAYPIRTGLP